MYTVGCVETDNLQKLVVSVRSVPRITLRSSDLWGMLSVVEPPYQPEVWLVLPHPIA